MVQFFANIVERKYVFNLRIAENDPSAVQDDAGTEFSQVCSAIVIFTYEKHL